MNACFSKAESKSQVGSKVESARDLPEVPAGSHGRITGAKDGGVRGWTLKIEWDLPRRRSEMMAQLGEFSFNVPWRAKRLKADFSRSEVERLLKQLG